MRAISKLSFSEMEEPVKGQTTNHLQSDVSDHIQIYHNDQVMLTFHPMHG